MKLAFLFGLIAVALIVLLFAARVAIARFTPEADNLIQDGHLQGCPSSLKCYQITVPVNPEDAHTVLQRLLDQAQAQPRTQLIRHADNYAHITFRSRLMGYIDDLELLVDGGHLYCRSASRIGRSDLGANRKRVREMFEAVDLNHHL